MNKILFKDNLFQLVKEGRKTEIRRMSYYGKIGDILIAQSDISNNYVSIVITNFYKERLNEIDRTSILNGGFKNKEEFLEKWDGFYNNSSLNPEVFVYEFRLL